MKQLLIVVMGSQLIFASEHHGVYEAKKPLDIRIENNECFVKIGEAEYKVPKGTIFIAADVPLNVNYKNDLASKTIQENNQESRMGIALSAAGLGMLLGFIVGAVGGIVFIDNSCGYTE